MAAADTIAALATPRGRGALGVIRVSGDRAWEVVGKCLADRDRFFNNPVRQIGLHRFSSPTNGFLIDQITAVRYQSPRSATGENMVEVICHGGDFVVAKVLEALLAAGARYARRGEFSKRAFLNGKASLLQMEAVHALIESGSDAQHGSAVRAVLGEYDSVLKEVRELLEKALVEIEAAIEFPEEDDVKEGEGEQGLALCREVRVFMEDELAKRERIRRVDQGIVVAIVGEPNVGKSTLFNSMLRAERSLVHGESGTTRDFVSEPMEIAGCKVRLVDTAGIRETEETVERMGAERSWQQAQNAHVVVWVTSAGKEMSETERLILRRCGATEVVGVVSKTDLADPAGKLRKCEEAGVRAVGACLVEPESTRGAVGLIEERVGRIAEACGGETLIQNRRQEVEIEGAVEELKAAEEEAGLGDEVVAYRIRCALGRLEEFVGESMPEDILERIFREFCIGK